MPETSLSVEVLDQFRKANVLHTYVQSHLSDAVKHAVEVGQLLLDAKSRVPHGRWESECDRLFDGSLRTAQFYMRLAKDLKALPKAQEFGVLYLESTIEGAAKAARKAAEQQQQNPPSNGGENVQVAHHPPVEGTTPETPSNASSGSTGDESGNGAGTQETARQEPESVDPKQLAKKNRDLAHSYRDKLARAVCDYHEVKPNRAERDRLVKLVQGVVLWK